MAGGHHRRRRSAALAAAAVAALVSPAGLRAQATAPDRQSGEAMAVNLPLMFSGAYLGDIAARVSADGTSVSVNLDDFLRLASPRLTLEMQQQLRDLPKAGEMIDIAALKPAGVEVAYDPSTLELAVSIPLDKQGQRSLKLVETAAPSDGSFESAAGLSGSSTFNASQAISHEGRIFNDFEPLKAINQTALNIGGPGGLNVFAEFYFDGAERRAFGRGPITLTHENRGKALRLLAGDVLPTITGFQSGSPLGGIGIEKSYSTLQPYRNVRPAGLFKFALEEPAVVEVVVNGSPVRTFRLDRGQYDLRDFNFASGLNQVELYVIDDYGRRLISSFSQFFNFDLLNPGISEFGAFVGMPQERTSDGQIAYGGRPTFTGFYRRGITQTLTLGADFQSDVHQTMGGLSAGFASKLGTFSLAAAVSNDKAAGFGHQLLLNYQLGADGLWLLDNPTVDFELRKRSRNFIALGDIPGQDATRLEVRGRLSASLLDRYGIGLYGLFTDRREMQANYSIGASLSMRVLGFSATANVERTKSDEGAANRFFVSLGRSLGSRRNSRSSYDTTGGAAQMEISRFRDNSLGDYGYRAGFARTDQGLAANGEFTYNANRAFLAVRHDIASDPSGRNVTQRSSFSVATEVAFAGGKVGIGRPVGYNFILAYPHRTLKSDVLVAQGVEDEKILARSGWLGPALAPAGAAHSPRQLTIRAEQVPDGYDPGNSYFELLPGPATGYAAQVGSDEWRTVQGTLTGPDGEPVKLAVGSLVWLDKPSHNKTQIFTNGAGRFVATGLAAGRYRLEIGSPTLQSIIVIPDNDEGIIDAGQIAAVREVLN